LLQCYYVLVTCRTVLYIVYTIFLCAAVLTVNKDDYKVYTWTYMHKINNACAYTHVWFVFESVAAARSTTVEMCRFLIDKNTRRRVAIFSGTEPLESFLDDCRVLAMVVGVHLNVRRTDVDLAAAILRPQNQTMSLTQLALKLIA